MGRQSRYEDKKQVLLAHIMKVTSSHNRAPSVRELAEGASVGVATLHSYLGKMAEEGLIVWTPKSHRSLRLTDLGRDHLPKLPVASPSSP